MRVLILGASGYLGTTLYSVLKNHDFFQVIGTYCNSTKDYDLIKIDVTNEISVKNLINNVNPEVVVWTLNNSQNSNRSQKYLIELGLKNVVRYLKPTQKIVFMSTNAVFKGENGYYKEEYNPQYRNCNDQLGEYANGKIDGEKIVQWHHSYIIIRPGAIYGEDINGSLDNRTLDVVSKLQNGEIVYRTKNLFNTFVKVQELALAIRKLIEIDYKGIIHLGPEKKENYFEFFTNVAKSLDLNYTLLKGNYIEEEEVRKSDRCLDLSLDTSKARELLGNIFTSSSTR